jgi:hypothetical protein
VKKILMLNDKEESAAMLIPLARFVYTSSGSNSRLATFTTSASRAADILQIVAKVRL